MLTRGLIVVMSSGQGSVANNVSGMREVYRGSKAALNQLMRSYAARHSGTSRAMILMASGWVRTEMGGPNAHLSIEESVPNLVNVLLKKEGKAGLEYLDCLGRLCPGSSAGAGEDQAGARATMRSARRAWSDHGRA
jgi:NAD(P)-dependent dehydrogenase (short-subunit alcohol dehydrogenase family)